MPVCNGALFQAPSKHLCNTRESVAKLWSIATISCWWRMCCC